MNYKYFAAIVTISFASVACSKTNPNQALYDEYHSTLCEVNKTNQAMIKGQAQMTPEAVAAFQKMGMRNIELGGKVQKLASTDPEYPTQSAKALDMTTCK